MISVGIVGASGYTGEELARLLANHPNVKLKSLTSKTHEGKEINAIFKLDEKIPGKFKSPQVENLNDCDIVFFATPNGVAMNMANALIEQGIKVIDISADFRLTSAEQFTEWYEMKHSSPDLLHESVYGLPEMRGQREKIQHAQLVANPGCYPTSILLGVLPIIESLPEQTIIVDAKSGISGAGRNLNSKKLFNQGEENFQAYAVKNHRHYPETLNILQNYQSNLDLLFVPHLSSMYRGIFSTIYMHTKNIDIEEIRETFQNYYNGSEFVKIADDGEFPRISDVSNSNKCRIALNEVRNSYGKTNLVVFSLVDNLVKGASGQAVQNMNIMFNLDEKLGLI